MRIHQPSLPIFRPAPLAVAMTVVLGASLSACEKKDPCDGIDNDGDGYLDEDLDRDEEIRPWFPDADGDGFGDVDFVVAPPIWACAAPEGRVNNNFDCDDADAGIHPDTPESCNGVDDDCDGQVDDGVGDTYYTDGDGDGHGDPDALVVACEQPDDAVVVGDDCDDGNDESYPGAQEICDGRDNDCDGALPADEEDGDGDGFVACADCDDGDDAIHPGAFEICDGVDANCDGAVDDADNDGSGTVDCEEALVIVSWAFAQAQELCPVTLDPYPDMETLAAADALTDVGLGALTLVEDELEGIHVDAMAEHPVVVVLNGGLPWSAGFFNDTLPALQIANAAGVSLYVIGDDAADRIDDSAVMPDLFGLSALVSSGVAGDVDPSGSSHPTVDGPFGALVAFAVDADMDQVTAAGSTETPLLQVDGGHPALAVVDPDDRGRVAIQLFGIASTWDTCPVVAGDETALLARNVVDWLMD